MTALDFNKEVIHGLHKKLDYYLGDIISIKYFRDMSIEQDEISYSDLALEETFAYTERSDGSGNPLSRLKTWNFYAEDGSLIASKTKSKGYSLDLSVRAGRKRRENIEDRLVRGAKDLGLEVPMNLLFDSIYQALMKWIATGSTELITLLTANTFINFPIEVRAVVKDTVLWYFSYGQQGSNGFP